MTRFHRKVDANQATIVAALRKAGCSVLSLASLGHGAPDLLVGRGGENYLLEIKDGSLALSRKVLTPSEWEWHRMWCGQVAIAETVEEALKVVGLEVLR